MTALIHEQHFTYEVIPEDVLRLWLETGEAPPPVTRPTNRPPGAGRTGGRSADSRP